MKFVKPFMGKHGLGFFAEKQVEGPNGESWPALRLYFKVPRPRGVPRRLAAAAISKATRKPQPVGLEWIPRQFLNTLQAAGLLKNELSAFEGAQHVSVWSVASEVVGKKEESPSLVEVQPTSEKGVALVNSLRSALRHHRFTKIGVDDIKDAVLYDLLRSNPLR